MLDFLHYYGEILDYQQFGIMCAKPGQPTDSSNFYHLIPEIVYRSTQVPCIDDPLNPQNNVGKSTFQFCDIQKIFKVGYQAAFLGCFCDCHYQDHKKDDTKTENMSLSSQPFVNTQNGRNHPVYKPATGEKISDIIYQDENNQKQQMSVENLYLNERIPAS